LSDGPLSVKKNIAWNSAGNLVYLFSQWLLSFFVVKLLGFESAGVFSLAIAIAGSFIGISLYGMRSFQVSDITGKYPPSAYILSRYITSVVALAVCLIFLAINDYPMYICECILAYMCFKLSESLSDVYQGILQKAMRMDYIGISFIIKGVAILGLFIAVIALFKDLLSGIVILVLSSFAIVFLYDLKKARQFCPGKMNEKWRTPVTDLLKECLPIACFVFIFNTLAQVPRYFLEHHEGTEVLGVYATIGMPVVIVQVSASFIFAPLTTPFAQHLNGGDLKAFLALFWKTMLFLLGLSAIAFIGFKIIGDWVLVLLFGSAIRPYTYLLMPLVVCTILVAVSWFLSTILIVLRRLKTLLVISIISFTIVALGSVPCIITFGQNGASFILILGLSVYVLIGSMVILHGIKSMK